MKLTVMATIQQQPKMKAKTLTLREKEGGCVALVLVSSFRRSTGEDCESWSLTVSTAAGFEELLLRITWFGLHRGF